MIPPHSPPKTSCNIPAYFENMISDSLQTFAHKQIHTYISIIYELDLFAFEKLFETYPRYVFLS